MKRRNFVKSLTAAGASLLFELGGRFALQAEESAPDPSVKRVLVMFKCHFDAGFINTQYNVVHKYFNEYFPAAIEVARSQNIGGERRYVWTTGSWLLFEYLEQAAPKERRAMEEAIQHGDIAWHALPFTWQTELLNSSIIEGSLAIARSLDRRFGKVTTGAKMTDVPGHTRGIVAPLAKNDIRFLEIGVNGGSTPAVLPPLFLWQDPSGASLPVMYHANYGGFAHVPGSDLVVGTCVRDDNSGPHKPTEIAELYSNLALRFPKAELSAASLTDIANAVAPHRDNLPVITQEIGDTWIHGVASDPLKVARYRELCRLREDWIAKGALQVGDDTDLALLRHVLLEVEHTWGTDTKTWLDFENYKPADLLPMLDTKNYKVVEFSWTEKRQDLIDGVAALPSGLREEAQRAIEILEPSKPTLPIALHPGGKPIESAHYILEIDERTGAITRLRNKVTGREWATTGNPIALLTYQTLSQDDYQRFLNSYLTTDAGWAAKDFGKPNIERFGARSEDWHPGSTEIRREETDGADRILVQMNFLDTEASRSGRASFPRETYLEILLPKASPTIHLNISWFDKPATRLPEALWLTFNPVVEDQNGWRIEKSGQNVSPFEVVLSGNRHMHSLSSGFSYYSAGNQFFVDALDSPVVALGDRTPLGFSNSQPNLSRGIHSCLFNNAWGTNYIMWYGEDMHSRFVWRT
jgi:hypothetical protein